MELSKHLLHTYFTQPLSYEIMRYYLVLNTEAEVPAHKVLDNGVKLKDVEDSLLKSRVSFLTSIRKLKKMWAKSFRQGVEDNSIRNDITLVHLMHFVFMIISGIVDRAIIEKLPLEKAKLSTDKLIDMTVDLLLHYLSKA